jgi:hypothetical protein
MLAPHPEFTGRHQDDLGVIVAFSGLRQLESLHDVLVGICDRRSTASGVQGNGHDSDQYFPPGLMKLRY